MPYLGHLKDEHGHDDPDAGSGFLDRRKELVSHDLFGSSYDWYGVEWWGSSNDTVVKTSNMTHSLPFPLEFITYDIPWLMFMGYGNDSVTGYDEDDEIYGGHGDDSLRGGDGNDVLWGEEDNDRLWGGDGDDGLIGGDGNDQMWGDAGDDRLDGGRNNDQLNGGAGDDVLLGGEGNDTLNGNDGIDRLEGGDGNDRYYVRQGDNDTVVETWAGGLDRVDYAGNNYALTAYVEDLYLTGNYGTGAALWGNDIDNRITALGGNDTIAGLDGADTIYAGGGADVVDGGNGNDAIYGGLGNDNLYGGVGNDYLDGEDGADRMTGGLGDDRFIVDNAGDVVVEGANEGIDTVYSWLAGYTMTANVENLFLSAVGAANAIGNASNNTIMGNTFANHINGGAGADTVNGNLGNDSVHGEDGDDIVDGGGGDDSVFGGEGNDLVRGGDGADWVYGGGGNDTALGGNGNDFVYGDAGADQLSGQAGNDALYGGADGDTLRGGDGDDTIVGGIGADMLFGEAGADTFKFLHANESTTGAYDTVRDFLAGTDRFDLSAIDANALVAGDQAFSFYATKPFFSSAGDLWTSTVRGGVMVHGDLQGDGLSDFSFMVSGATSLNASNFVL